MGIRLEFMFENDKPNKKCPLYLEDIKFYDLIPDIRNDMLGLTTYKDLVEYSNEKKRRMLNAAYNDMISTYILKHDGRVHYGRLAIVAYDENQDLPIWVAVADNRYGNRLKCRYYDALQRTNRREFSWALRNQNYSKKEVL